MRKEFENGEVIDSFKNTDRVATHCFHVSSEGELEQALPLIQYFLDQGNFIELVYTSNSVTRKCKLLAAKYENLNLLRMPLLSFPSNSFRRWVTAKKLFMCRYDFFSELMLYGAREDVDFILLSASLKGKRLTGIKKAFTLGLYSCFDYIVAASDIERQNFLKLSADFNVTAFEFRLLQIASRLEQSESKFLEKRSLDNYFSILKNRDVKSNLIIGSAWEVELNIFKDIDLVNKVKSGEFLVVIAPHSLSKESLLNLSKAFNTIAPSLKLVNANEVDEYRSGEVYFNATPGILLESYSLFGHVLVGGGHGRSIHSVLEPYLAGSRVYCGPKIFRSTEFDFIKKESPNDVVVIENLEEISSSIVDYNRELEIDKRDKLINFYKSSFTEMMERF
ncbi:glycosyltransferase N-terminal domain-containing protein [Halobacteriovorax sp.]|uniref:glycosyltransferase N-terminal domain-containing protein n=1 Tax=Halobacteriovorax sp. TaxID=2020862 RepID=UPI0035660FA5